MAWSNFQVLKKNVCLKNITSAWIASEQQYYLQRQVMVPRTQDFTFPYCI